MNMFLDNDKIFDRSLGNFVLQTFHVQNTDREKRMNSIMAKNRILL